MQNAETVLGVLRERGRKGLPAGTAFMARKRRKTLVVCQPCHDAVHANPVTTRGIDHRRATYSETGPCVVRRRAARKRVPNREYLVLARPILFAMSFQRG